MKQPSLFDVLTDTPAVPDQAARDFAVDPANDVVLEASAGTGKTRVLVGRYVRLIEAGVDPRHILAITFTRKAAAEMRDRVLAELRRRAAEGAFSPAAWRALRERIADVQISTIDAFCFGLLREFPLEADVEPGFEIADETEMARFANEAIDLTFRAVRGLLDEDEPLRLLLARVKLPILRSAVAALLDRRHVALPAVASFVARQRGATTTAAVASAFVDRLRSVIDRSSDRAALVEDGPDRSPEFQWLRDDLRRLDALAEAGPAQVQQLRRRLERYFLTRNGDPRKLLDKAIKVEHFRSPDAKKRHEQAVRALAPQVLETIAALDVDVNALLARGLARLLVIAADRYERLLDEHGLLDFAGMLQKSVALLARQEEFARSRLKLQARYHHVLVDEFQDTSRLQWQLIELLVDAWGEGEGTADAPTSIFVVGDRKQSIYRFRHAEVTLLDEAARKIVDLRPGRRVRQVISTSFRAVPELLAFVNALSEGLQGDTTLPERFTFGDADRFPVPDVAAGALRDGEPVLGAIAESSMPRCAAAVAGEIDRLLREVSVRDRHGAARAARPDDIAILFRVRAGHQYFEEALEARGIRTYVYKGLGFFDAPEVQDLQALLRYLAEPESDLRAAELLRSRFIRVSDIALMRLAPAFAKALQSPPEARLDEIDRALLDRARTSLARWLALADRVAPSELVDLVLRESAYVFELGGRRLDQARENVKKVRALIRRVESRGYATLGRLADYFETLRAGDESNAIVEASGCVNLMTIHAAKGLEFPIVFVVNLHLAGRGRPQGFTVIERGADGEPEVAFGSSEGVKLEEQRELEELRRLTYVAATRARDRLYLATEIDGSGKVRRSARSLASLLPPSLTDTLAGAAQVDDSTAVVWPSPRGTFAFRVCRAGVAANAGPSASMRSGAGFDVVPLAAAGRPAIPVTAVLTRDESPPFHDAPGDSAPARLIGTLVHRLLQRGLAEETDSARIEQAIARLVRAEELVDIAEPASLAAEAATVYARLRRHPELVAALAAGECFYEVPFSYEPSERPGEWIRGVVDCLIVMPDGSVTVLEFKTGRPRPEHEDQAALYAASLEAALGVDRVVLKILYP
jgi:ATP-dependent helicase/nuclease subunit A